MREYHNTRLPHDSRRETLWKTLCESYFQRFVRSPDTVLELGCGYGDFINHIQCATKIAADRWPGIAEYLDRKSTRLNSSHLGISYAVFCLKKKKHRSHIQQSNVLTAITDSARRRTYCC